MKVRLLCGIMLLAAGCTQPEFNRTPPVSESVCLSNITQLTSGFFKAGNAAFSPDTGWIIFQAARKANEPCQEYLAQLKRRDDSSSPDAGITGIYSPIAISPAPSRNTGGAFSSNGVSLIFASTAGSEEPGQPPTAEDRVPPYPIGGQFSGAKFPAKMEIFRADGWQGAIAAIPPGTAISLARHKITFNETYSGECSFSPDSKFVVFTSNHTGHQEIWIMHADGTSARQLTHGAGHAGEASISPDGKHLVFRRDGESNSEIQIFIADLVFNGSEITGMENQRELTHGPAACVSPTWYSDGQHIVFESGGSSGQSDRATSDLNIMRADGSHKTRLNFGSSTNVLPAFSADGKWLLWTTDRASGQGTQVFVARFALPAGS